jgi:DNA-damage-inducible protein J
MMQKTAMIRARMEPDLKQHAEEVLAKVGLSPTEAIRLFYRQVSLQGGLPFDVRVPNAATRAAVSEARAGKKLKTFSSASELIRKAGA